MLDFAWSEFLVVIVVAVLVIGPKQLPEVLYAVGRVARRLQYMKFALSKQFEDFMEQSDLNEIRKFKQTTYDMALHHGVDEEDVEMERNNKLSNSPPHPDPLPKGEREVEKATGEGGRGEKNDER